MEHVENSLLCEKFRPKDIASINTKRRVYKELLDQTMQQEHHLQSLNELARDYTTKLTYEQNRHLKDELINYGHRLNDIKMFLTNALTRCNGLEKSMTDFEVKHCLRKFQSDKMH